MKPFEIRFLHHSGFIVELEKHIFVFDYYLDPENQWEKIEHEGKKVYFFVSHMHGDHFNPSIRRFENQVSAYFIHSDCVLEAGNPDCIHPLRVGDTCEEGDISVHMYGSTDAGGSFMVQAEGMTIYHAGDLNWWHWAGERDRENRTARDDFFRELGNIKESHVDIAFIPVDARQQVAREWGVKQYLSHFDASLLVPMHAFGQRWEPSYEFRWLYPDQKIWIPKGDGDSYREMR